MNQDKKIKKFFLSYVVGLLGFIAGLLLIRQESFVAYIFAFVIIGSFQNFLGVLMHEGSHFFLSESKRTSEKLSNYLVCYPILSTVDAYRREHVLHHKLFGLKDDPYFPLYHYESLFGLFKGLVSDVLGLTAISKFLKRNDKVQTKSFKHLFFIALYQFILFTLFFSVTSNLWSYLFFWIVPLALWTPLINRIRAIGEHTPVLEEEIGHPISRDNIPGLIDFFIFAPVGYSYHGSHHVDGSIPYYELPKFSMLLLKKDGVVCHHGYIRQFFKAMFFLSKVR